MAQKDELRIPDLALSDQESFEIIRVWIANKDQHCTIKMGVWENPAAWGILLADLARHIANTFEIESRSQKTIALQKIIEAFDVELRSPTDDPRGKEVS